MSGRFPPLRFARNQVGEGSPTISANNLQSQKPARSGYYGQSIGHDIISMQPETILGLSVHPQAPYILELYLVEGKLYGFLRAIN